MISKAAVRDEVFIAKTNSKYTTMDVFLGILLNFSEQLKFLSNWFVKKSDGQLFSFDVPAFPVFHFKSLNI